MVAAGLAGAARAQTDVVAGSHISDEHWTLAGSPYRLKGQVYFTNSSVLTIDAGVVVASLPADEGSLAICRDSQIFVNGTRAMPVIMTSTNDVATWTGTTGAGATQIPGDPRTGTWRVAANEWGNLTIMGNGYISENAVLLGNTQFPDAGNEADMEGLNVGPATDRYGGGNDDDDSGSISYLSIRYTGRVVGLGNELNGLSLGGIGRNTDIDYVEIMNNVDDGIEIWGGAVNLKHFSIWNIGDDSFDVDQGWRGKAQFGLIVQGYSVVGAQGSGVGDNCFETDGGEAANYQPLTTATIYNCTVIGQPKDGDHATDWRDGARVQYRNCIFMDIGEELVQNSGTDGDSGSFGYGHDGTLTFAQTWTTDYNAVPPHPGSDFTTGTYATNYPAQTSGKLSEMKDSVFFSNVFAPGAGDQAYTEANTQGVFAGGNNNVLSPGAQLVGAVWTFDAANAPIVGLTRGPATVVSGKTMYPVLTLDPRPANAAVASVAGAPADGFFTTAMYRGAFEPSTNKQTWLCEWTASSAFGFTDCETGTPSCFPGTGGVIACPCAQPANPAGGCANFGAGSTTGAVLSATGVASLASDTVLLTTSNHRTPAQGVLNVFFSFKPGGPTPTLGAVSGAGVTCKGTGGSLKRLYTVQIFGGAGSKPAMGDLSVSAQSATFAGHAIVAPETRHYYNVYRDGQAAAPANCNNPAVTTNLTNMYSIQWAP